ncbi:hypothetical protein KIPB_007730, partial [Kipferlia bialata]
EVRYEAVLCLPPLLIYLSRASVIHLLEPFIARILSSCDTFSLSMMGTFSTALGQTLDTVPHMKAVELVTGALPRLIPALALGLQPDIPSPVRAPFLSLCDKMEAIVPHCYRHVMECQVPMPHKSTVLLAMYPVSMGCVSKGGVAIPKAWGEGTSTPTSASTSPSSSPKSGKPQDDASLVRHLVVSLLSAGDAPCARAGVSLLPVLCPPSALPPGSTTIPPAVLSLCKSVFQHSLAAAGDIAPSPVFDTEGAEGEGGASTPRPVSDADTLCRWMCDVDARFSGDSEAEHPLICAVLSLDTASEETGDAETFNLAAGVCRRLAPLLQRRQDVFLPALHRVAPSMLLRITAVPDTAVDVVTMLTQAEPIPVRSAPPTSCLAPLANVLGLALAPSSLPSLAGSPPPLQSFLLSLFRPLVASVEAEILSAAEEAEPAEALSALFGGRPDIGEYMNGVQRLRSGVRCLTLLVQLDITPPTPCLLASLSSSYPVGVSVCGMRLIRRLMERHLLPGGSVRPLLSLATVLYTRCHHDSGRIHASLLPYAAVPATTCFEREALALYRVYLSSSSGQSQEAPQETEPLTVTAPFIHRLLALAAGGERETREQALLLLQTVSQREAERERERASAPIPGDASFAKSVTSYLAVSLLQALADPSPSLSTPALGVLSLAPDMASAAILRVVRNGTEADRVTLCQAAVSACLHLSVHGTLGAEDRVPSFIPLLAAVCVLAAQEPHPCVHYQVNAALDTPSTGTISARRAVASLVCHGLLHPKGTYTEAQRQPLCPPQDVQELTLRALLDVLDAPTTWDFTVADTAACPPALLSSLFDGVVGIIAPETAREEADDSRDSREWEREGGDRVRVSMGRAPATPAAMAAYAEAMRVDERERENEGGEGAADSPSAAPGGISRGPSLASLGNSNAGTVGTVAEASAADSPVGIETMQVSAVSVSGGASPLVMPTVIVPDPPHLFCLVLSTALTLYPWVAPDRQAVLAKVLAALPPSLPYAVRTVLYHHHTVSGACATATLKL